MSFRTHSRLWTSSYCLYFTCEEWHSGSLSNFPINSSNNNNSCSHGSQHFYSNIWEKYYYYLLFTIKTEAQIWPFAQVTESVDSRAERQTCLALEFMFSAFTVVILKVCPWDCRASIPGELVRTANPWAKSELLNQVLYFNRHSPWFWCHQSLRTPPLYHTIASQQITHSKSHNFTVVYPTPKSMLFSTLPNGEIVKI